MNYSKCFEFACAPSEVASLCRKCKTTATSIRVYHQCPQGTFVLVVFNTFLHLDRVSRIFHKEASIVYDLVNQIRQLEAACELRVDVLGLMTIDTSRPSPRSGFNLADFNVDPLNNFRNKTQVIIGPSSCGKTSFVMAHFLNALLVNKPTDILLLSASHDGIVFKMQNYPVDWTYEELLNLCKIEEEVTKMNGLECWIPANLPRCIVSRYFSSILPNGVSMEQLVPIMENINYEFYQDTLY